MRRQAFAGHREALRGADVIPLAIMHDRGEATGGFGPIEEPDQREDASGRRVEEPPVQQLVAGEMLWCHLALATAARVSRRIEEIVAVALIADRGHRRLQQDDAVRIRGIEGIGEAE